MGMALWMRISGAPPSHRVGSMVDSHIIHLASLVRAIGFQQEIYKRVQMFGDISVPGGPTDQNSG